jgi:glyoxylase-like metal-dependent hydrolase (beta-lactamase superfamily II)
MTLDGTNTFVIRAPGAVSSVVVDPGPEIPEHLDRIESLGPVELILLTHHHADHAASAPELARRTGAPVRAFRPDLCIDADPLLDGDAIDAAGARIITIATPGHTHDSVCFQLPGDSPFGADERLGSILTGDTILGRGTTILAQPTGALRDYLRSLERLRDLESAQLVLPAHGPALPRLATVAADYLTHRAGRLAQLEAALEELGLRPSRDPAVIARVTDLVYRNISSSVRFAAEASTAAQLEYLVDQG